MIPQGLLLVSFAPGLFWLWFFTRLDVYRPAPRRLIAISFFLGCLSTIPAAILEGVFLKDVELDIGVGNRLVVGKSGNGTTDEAGSINSLESFPPIAPLSASIMIAGNPHLLYMFLYAASIDL